MARKLTAKQHARKLELNKAYRERLKLDPERLENFRKKTRARDKGYYYRDIDKRKEKAKERRLNWTEEQREKARSANKRHRDKVEACPVLKRQYAEYRRKWQNANYRRRVSKTSEPLLGSVLAASAPSYWRDILAALNDAMPRCADRDDMISQAALFMIEGDDLDDAVNKARTVINRQADPYRKTVRIEEVFSLC